MEEIHQIEYNGKTYKVYEPTLDVWSALMTEQSWSNDFELAVTLIAWITGLTEDEVKQASATSIINAADGIIDYYTNQSAKFYETFTFNQKNYKFIDIPNLTFGEFIDIDEFLIKEESQKNARLNELLALLYREVDEKGNYLPYDVNRIKQVSEDFRKLPIKYLNGALVFFSTIESMLQKNTRLYLYQKIWWIWKYRMLKIRVKRITKILSAGIVQLYLWLRIAYLISTKWFKKIISNVSIL